MQRIIEKIFRELFREYAEFIFIVVLLFIFSLSNRTLLKKYLNFIIFLFLIIQIK